MSSAYAPKWRRILYRIIPWLFITCPEYNWRWDRLCFCSYPVLDLKTGIRYVETSELDFRPDNWKEVVRKRRELVEKIRERKFQ